MSNDTKKTNWGIQITGAIYNKNYSKFKESFADEFIDWIESKGWYYGGSFKDIDLDKEEG